MRWLYKFPLRVRSLFRRQQAENELSEELQSHLQFQIEQNVQQGMDPQEARFAALRSMGGIEQLKEECREARNVGWLENFLRDLRFGTRMLVRNPGFTLVAVLCLTLGIGANAAVFSWIEGILFRPYPGVANLDRLMVLAATARGTQGYDVTSWPNLLDYQRRAKLVDVIGEKITSTTLAVGDRAEIATGSMVSANYFDAMSIRLNMGRGFQPGEDTGRNAHPVVVISYQLWKDRFRSDPNIVGKTQVFNALPHTIVGVTAPGFFGTFVGYPFKFWVPMSMQERFDPSGYKLEDRGARWLEPFVRLKPGVSVAQAQQEMTAIASRLEAEYPDTNRGMGIRLLPLWQSPFNASTFLVSTLGIALAVAFFVLLIACANVGNLLLVKSFSRSHEITVRMAIGAGRSRLVKQLLTEGLLLTGIAAIGGMLVANWCRGLLVRVIPSRGVPLRFEGTLDWRVVAVSAAICGVSTLLFGLVPALQASNFDLAGALKGESGTVVGGGGRKWMRSGLVVVQVSLTFLLLVGAGLLVKSVERIRNSPPGFNPQGVLVTSANLFVAGYDLPRARNFQDQLMDRLQSLSGVQSAAYARIVPFSFKSYKVAQIAVDGFQAPPDRQPAVEYDEISPGFFDTLRIPLISGRDFTRADDENAPPVAIVNQQMVETFWRGEDPVGKRLKVKDTWMRVVGVAKLAKYGDPMEPDKPFFYVPLKQNPTVQVSILLRTPQSPESMLPVLAREVHTLDPGLAVYAVTTMREQVDIQTAPQHIALSLLTVFGSMALLLAAIGLYGVMSYAVTQSTRELGLRMALGATPRQLLRLVMSKGMTLTGVGIVLGGAAALSTTRLLGYLLYKVSPRDPLSFLSALGVMTVTGIVACLLPAWRAARIDPLSALRN
jgi:predicted permease